MRVGSLVEVRSGLFDESLRRYEGKKGHVTNASFDNNGVVRFIVEFWDKCYNDRDWFYENQLIEL